MMNSVVIKTFSNSLYFRGRNYEGHGEWLLFSNGSRDAIAVRGSKWVVKRPDVAVGSNAGRLLKPERRSYAMLICRRDRKRYGQRTYWRPEKGRKLPSLTLLRMANRLLIDRARSR